MQQFSSSQMRHYRSGQTANGCHAISSFYHASLDITMRAKYVTSNQIIHIIKRGTSIKYNHIEMIKRFLLQKLKSVKGKNRDKQVT
jgi:hypothetical protein